MSVCLSVSWIAFCLALRPHVPTETFQSRYVETHTGLWLRNMKERPRRQCEYNSEIDRRLRQRSN